MPIMNDTERSLADELVRLSYCNPFVPERFEIERAVLGNAFVESQPTWHKGVAEELYRLNLDAITDRSRALAETIRGRLLEGQAIADADRDRYETIALYSLYSAYDIPFDDQVQRAQKGGESRPRFAFYASFRADMEHFFALPGHTFACLDESEHYFAGMFQLLRAFHYVYHHIIGSSPASTRLRAAVWESIFTCDLRRYQRGLYRRMADITTLITGPSGTGKELVARAIGLSRYIPFDAQTMQFAEGFTAGFHPTNLSAIAPTLIEAELFGHAKGAFTGALADRAGLFESCTPHGTVFLDELGELPLDIQVKLLRVLQTRTFHRVGEIKPRQFDGKIVAATNRDLATAMRERRFREDLYYRLCSDTIETPSLREQIQDAPEQLSSLISFIAERVAGAEIAPALASEVKAWIAANLDPAYAWPGNVRELEQCVRNIMIRRTYRPPATAPTGPADVFLQAVRDGRLTAEEMMSHYCSHVYAQCGTYQEAARHLGLDGRTVKKYVTPQTAG